MKNAYWLLVAFVACRTAPQTIAARQVASISEASGAVSAKLVPDPNSPLVQLGPDEDFVRPYLRPENPPPAYPADLIALHLQEHTIAVRVTFDEAGRLFDVAPSPIAASTDDAYRPAFEQSVRDALKSWRCSPPRIRKFRPGPDGDGDGKPDYRIMVTQKPLKTFFDLSFAFAVVNGQPVVKAR